MIIQFGPNEVFLSYPNRLEHFKSISSKQSDRESNRQGEEMEREETFSNPLLLQRCPGPLSSTAKWI